MKTHVNKKNILYFNIMKITICFIFALIASTSFGQKMRFKVIGQKDTTVHLVKYYGDKMYYADTVQSKNGIIEFDGSKQKPGVFAVFFPSQKYFDFIYNNEEIYIETSLNDLVKDLKVRKSEENTLFINYIRYITENKTKANELSEKRKEYDKSSAEYTKLTSEIKTINDNVLAYQKNLIETNKDKLVGSIVKMSSDIQIPEAPVDANGKVIDTFFAYNYFKAHFWDNVNLKDDRLLNTPVFHNKLAQYFGKTMLVQHWDTIIKYAFDFCDRLDPKSEIFKYTVTWITSSYEQSNIMGMDKVFVKMGERYYCSKNSEGKSPAYWMAEKKLAEFCDKVKVNLNLVMGATPPNIILRDTTDVNWRDFKSLKSEYTILYFWDPECGHCKKVTPKLGELYTKKWQDRNIEVFAVGKAVGDEFQKWKDFIKKYNLTYINVGVTESLFVAALENPREFVPEFTTLESLNYQLTYDIFTTPRVFVLDKDKKIIAKGLTVAQLEELLDRLQGKADEPKLFPPDAQTDEEMH